MHLLLITPILAVALLRPALGAEGPRPCIPAEKNPEIHQKFLEDTKAGGIDLVFLGDSITANWVHVGNKAWDQRFAPLKAADFGISGDRTEHVLWRIHHGVFDILKPKLVVLMIGTNNREDSAEDVALGIKAIIGAIQQRSPRTRILLLGIFPRGDPSDPLRLKNEKTNSLIARFDMPVDPKCVVYLDIGAKFMAPDKTLSKDIMPDSLHLSPKGYQIWADAILPQVKSLMQEDPAHLAPVFSKRSTVAKVSAVEEQIMAGGLVIGMKMLDQLAGDKDPATAAAAKDCQRQLDAWREAIDAGIESQCQSGDIFSAAEMSAAMSRLYGGEVAKGYKGRESELRKDPAYATGKEYHRLASMSQEARRDPRYRKLVEAFIGKHPDGYYATRARALLEN